MPSIATSILVKPHSAERSPPPGSSHSSGSAGSTHVLRSLLRRWQHLTKALCDSSGGQRPDAWHCAPFLALHAGCTALALGFLGVGEASNIPQLNNGVQQDRLQVCLPAGEPVSPPRLCLQGPRPGHAASPSSASPELSLLEHPHSQSRCAPTATPTSFGEWREQKSIKQKRERHTHPSAKTSFGSESFSMTNSSKYKTYFAFAPSLQCKSSKCACATCKHEPAVAQQTPGPCCCPQPWRNTA